MCLRKLDNVFIMPKGWERFWYLQKWGRYNHIKIFLENLIFFAYEKKMTAANRIMSNLEIQLRNKGLKNFELFREIAKYPELWEKGQNFGSRFIQRVIDKNQSYWN